MFVKTLGVALVVGLFAGQACINRQERVPAGDTAQLYRPTGIQNLDPIRASDVYTKTELDFAYEGLYQYHYLKRPYILIPNLARQMPLISDRGRTYRIQLKSGVLFQDDPAFRQSGGKGRELVAQDVVYSWKRLADPRNQSSGWWIFDGKIVGLNEWREAQAKAGHTNYDSPVPGLRVIDRYTLEIRLNRRFHQFGYYLAMPFTYIIPRELVAAYGPDFAYKPAGTGPFRLNRKLTSWSKGRLVWDRNPTYREEFYPRVGMSSDSKKGLLQDAGKRLPFLERVVTEVISNGEDQWQAFQRGKIDLLAAIPKTHFDRAVTPTKTLRKELESQGVRLLKAVELDVTHEAFNMLDPVVGKNRYLRQALSLAYNIRPVIKTFYQGGAIEAAGPIPPGLPSYDRSLTNRYRRFDLARAKTLLAKAGYPGGKGLKPIRYLALDNPFSVQMAEYLKRSFSDLGVKLDVSTHAWEEFRKALRERAGQMFGYAWQADYPDAENFLQLFYSKNIGTGPNDSGYRNKKYDRLFEQARELKPGKKRKNLYQKMVRMLVSDCPWIFGVHHIRYALMNPWFKNFKWNDFLLYQPKYLRVVPSLKAKVLAQ